MKNALLLISVLVPLVVFGQSHRLFTSDKELSSSLVNGIYQDRNDMVWILTENGLNRFDGVKFTVYKNDPDNASSLNHNFVNTIFEDREGHLFVGGHNGIQAYDTSSDTFSPLATLPDGYPVSESPTAIIQRKNGEIWVSGNFLSRLHTDGAVPSLEEVKLPMPNMNAKAIMEDSAGNLWICRAEDGVYKLSPDNRMTHYLGGKETPCILFLYEDPFSGILYGGSPNGLFRHDPRTDSFMAIPCDSKATLLVKAILSVAPHQLYIGTDGNGMKVYDDRTGRITDFQWESDLIDLKDAKVHDIRRDREGNLWLAIFQRGVLVLPAQENDFGYIGYKSGRGNVIGSKSVTSFWKGNDGVLYVGTDCDGLYALNPDGSLKAHYRHTDDPHSVPPIVINLFEDSRGRLWIGSYGSGAAIMDKRSGRCDYQPLNGRDEKSEKNVYAFAEDPKRDRLWVGTMGSGLFYYDMKRGVMAVDTLVRECTLTNWIDCLHYSARHDRLYIGSYSGLLFIDLENPDRERQKIELIEQIIYCLYEDEEGNLWAGSSGGLSCWNQQTGELVTYTPADGLCSDAVYAIQGDETGRLWVSTSNGLSHFFVKERRFVNYYASDGMQGNEFSKNASFRDKEGILWFGGINGITYFDPRKIAFPHKKYTPRITDFYLYGSPVRTSTLSGGSPVIDCPVFAATEFRLSWPDNSFSIELSTQELGSPERITYLYTIENDHWIALPQGTNHISFTKLPPGTYRFRFKAKDHDVESDVRQVTIRIAPPWWRTAWAYAAYVLLALTAAYLVFRAIRQHYQAKQEALRHTHERQLNEARMQLFINIAHEIRTPMTLIINPLRKLMSSDTDETRQQEYHTIQRNSDRILRLVNDLLDVRKIDKGQMRLTFSETEMVGYLQGVCDLFTELSEQRQTALTFRHDGIESLRLWIDPENFDKVLLNLLSNAFKFTPQGGRIEVSLRVCQPDGTWQEPYARICVTDSGIGIPEEDLEHVFSRFYQVRDHSGHTHVGGSGIGLHLTRSLVELHHGHVRAERVAGEKGGTRFVVELPVAPSIPKGGGKNQEVSGQEPAVKSDLLTANAGLLTSKSSPKGGADGVTSRPHTRHRVMVVEDDEEIRRYLQGELSRDYPLTLCADGYEALESIHQKAPDLVVSDIMMPRMDGLTLCRKLKQNVRLNHIPVILLTAKAREQDNLEGLETGADAYLTKPFNIDILRQTIANLLESRQQLRNIYSGDQQASVRKLQPLQAETPDEKLMERVMRCVNRHLSEPDLTVEAIASEVGLSRAHLYRKLKELTNQNPRDFVRNLRLRQAATLLEEKGHAIGEVAALVGFTDLSTFSTAFKALYGVSPTEYRSKNMQDRGSEKSGEQES